jgi:hypothetical protein
MTRSLLAGVTLALSLGCGQTTATVDAGADAAPIDAGSDVDNGAPSTNYPAPHQPLPQLVNAAKGPILTAPNAYLIFFPSYPYETGLQSFAKSAAGSQYWSTTTGEYGVGPLTYAGTIDLTESAPAMLSQSDVQTWMGNAIQTGKLGTPDPQAIYTIVYPLMTVITEPNPVSPVFGNVQSCQAFGGYHDNVSVAVGDAGTPTTFAYAVIPTCGPLPTLTEAISHEWVEASTDPELTSSGTFTLTGGPNAAFYSPDQNHIVWALLGGGEAGDLCEPEGQDIYIAADVGNLVQRTWSNASAMGSHDPCVPSIPGAFFDSVPVLSEMVSFNSPLTGMVTTQGVTIPVGSSKTLEVDMFSDGDTGGPWNVAADDVLSTYYGAYGIKPSMTFAWDRTSGQNGEKLHLTITVTTGSGLTGGAHAFEITSTLGSRQAVWPGLVVEQ